jgi:hypothetical protein
VLFREGQRQLAERKASLARKRERRGLGPKLFQRGSDN